MQITDGVGMILLGIVIPPGYLVLTLMTWSDPSKPGMIVVGTSALFCIVFGITAIVKARY